MNLEKFLVYVTHHSETITQWLIVATLSFTGLILLFWLVRRKDDSSSSSAASAEIQSALEKLLEQTAKLQNVTVTATATGEPAADLSNVDEQVQTLKSELLAREGEIAALKAAGDKNTSGASGAATELSAKIKDLEAKLAEYAILEDDIADLSLYKDENQRLKSELEKFKAGGNVPASAPAPVEPEVAIPKPEPEAVAAVVEDLTTAFDPGKSNDIVAEFAQAIQKPEAEAPPAALPPEPMPGSAPEPPPPEPVMAAPAPPPPAPEPVAPPPPAAAPAPKPFATSAAPAPAAASAATPEGAAPAAMEADDLFAEFAVEAPPEEGLDTSKMMEEMAALANIEPTTEDSLQGAIDTEKMAAEATGLNKS